MKNINPPACLTGCFFPLPVEAWLNRGADIFLLFVYLYFSGIARKERAFKSIYQCPSSARARCLCLLSASQSEEGVLTPLVWGSTVLAYRLQLHRRRWRRLKGPGWGMLDVLFSDVECLMCRIMSRPHWVWSEADTATQWLALADALWRFPANL